MTNLKRCAYCNEEINLFARKCRHSGEWFDQLERPPVTNTSIPPTTINEALASKFRIIKEAGKGGMSIVYKAVQKNLIRTIALKVLLPYYNRQLVRKYVFSM